MQARGVTPGGTGRPQARDVPRARIGESENAMPHDLPRAMNASLTQAQAKVSAFNWTSSRLLGGVLLAPPGLRVGAERQQPQGERRQSGPHPLMGFEEVAFSDPHGTAAAKDHAAQNAGVSHARHATSCLHVDPVEDLKGAAAAGQAGPSVVRLPILPRSRREPHAATGSRDLPAWDPGRQTTTGNVPLLLNLIYGLPTPRRALAAGCAPSAGRTSAPSTITGWMRTCRTVSSDPSSQGEDRSSRSLAPVPSHTGRF